MKRLFVTIGCIIILIAACNKQRGRFSPIPADIKDKINWQLGSYWIMEDSATHRVDSFYITSYEVSTRYGSEDNTNEQIVIGINEQCINLPITDTIFWVLQIGNLGVTNNLIMKGYYNTCLIGRRDYLIYPNSDAYSNYHSSYIFNGFTYQDVYLNGVYPVPDTGMYINIALQGGNGFAYIGFRNCGYNYNWFLKRKNIVH